MSTPTSRISTWSASAVSLFDPGRGGCNRKWYFERVMKVPRAQHPAAVNGQRIHKVLEDLYTGALTEIPAVLRPAFDRGHLPTPPAPLVEVELDFRAIGDRFQIGAWRANGRIDLLIREPGCPVVLDLKTSSSYRYSATEETLARDVQAILYSAVAQELTGEKTSRFGHVQVLTTVRPDSRLVMVDMPAQHVIDQMQGSIIPAVLAMQDAEHALTVADLPANRGACQSYGGCPFISQCAAATSAYHLNKSLTASTTEDIMPVEPSPAPASVLSALAQFKARSAAPAPAPAPQPALSEADEEEILLGSIGTPSKTPAPAQKANLATMAALPPAPAKPTPAPAQAPAPAKPAQAPAKPPAPAPVAEPVKRDSASRPELVVYVNCRPDDGAQDMNAVLLPLRAKVAEVNKVAHWGLVDFGKGAASVAALLDIELAAGRVSGEVWMSLSDPGMREALQVMSCRASKIVRGMP